MGTAFAAYLYMRTGQNAANERRRPSSVCMLEWGMTPDRLVVAPPASAASSYSGTPGTALDARGWSKLVRQPRGVIALAKAGGRLRPDAKSMAGEGEEVAP
jgi:hypothetical protein